MTDTKGLIRYVRLARVCIVFTIVLTFGGAAFQSHAQTGLATLNGQVVDPQDAVIPNASVTIISSTTAVQRQATSNKDGNFTFVALQPGTYSLHVEHHGFAATDATDITLHTADNVALVVKLKVGRADQTVTVSGAQLTTDSPAVSMTVSREFVENMPLNGRSVQDLVQLAPGVVSSGTGYYSINGQRTDSNNYTVDGVSANLGGINNTANGNSIGPELSGASPSQTVLGTTQSLVSVDALQEFTIQISSYTAEYGRNPGGQVQFTTRAGTNQIQGSLFEYLRNTAFDANSFDNDYNHEPKTAEHQNDFGGTVGGPLIIPGLYNGRDRTFYFASYEGLRLLLPTYESEYVSTQAFRQWASPNVQPFLNVAPLPNPSSPGNQDGCEIPGTSAACDALFYHAYSYPNNLENMSLRIDQTLSGRLHAFVRYADTASSKRTGLEQVEMTTINSHMWTVGATWVPKNGLLDELRFNYSHDGEESLESLASFSGSVPWDRSLLIPTGYDTPYAFPEAEVHLSGTSLTAESREGGNDTAQHQYEVVDSLTSIWGSHAYKFGVDWRRLAPILTSLPYQSYLEIESLSAIQQGSATSLVTYANASGRPVFNNFSLYAQDHWKVRPSLSLDYGLRWEFNPPPGPSNGFFPVALTSSNLATATLTTDGSQPYKTNYHSFAPRFGFSWRAIASSGRTLSVRGGFGIYFDTGQTTIGNAYSSTPPFSATRPTQSNVQLPLSQAALAPPSLTSPLSPPYPQLQLSDPSLTLPYTEAWSLSLDGQLNAQNTLTVSYVGNNGRKLLFTQYYDKIPENPAFTTLFLGYNGSQSSYNALQIQEKGRLTHGLDLVGSFTWAHALDDASSDYNEYAPVYGNSNFDLRRVLNLALNYQVPAKSLSSWTKAITRGWLLANRFSAQSGYPLNITESTAYLSDGTYIQYSPDLVPGVPIYLHGRVADLNGVSVPSGWRLNRAAFACTTNGATDGACPGTPTRQGTLGRNFIRNPSFFALNTAVQRNFLMNEKLSLNFRAEAFNILNHPNLGDPGTTLSASTFGQLGTGVTTIGSSNPLYAMGAARSLQLSLKAVF